MTKITKYNFLKYIPNKFETENIVNPERIFELNKNIVKKGNIIYLCERELRAHDNFALQFSIQKSKELNLPLKIIYPEIKYKYKFKQEFINRQILQTKKEFENINLDIEIYKDKNIFEYLSQTKTAALIIDFNPILNRNIFNKAPYKVYEIDGHNIIPAKFISNKQEYNAKTFRTKVYNNIFQYLTEYQNISNYKNEADYILQDFIQNKLQYYSEFKNNPEKNILSGLSKYLNLGFISSQKTALEVIKSKADDINKEMFLEELIIRKELADNFCLYCNNFKSFDSISNWAKKSLSLHKYDLRSRIYNLETLENAKTKDDLWNASQNQLKKEGIIHGYIRMYWAKKIFEWSITPEAALKTAIYLNDKYAYDAPSSNGYTGILWAMGGLHDRAFQDFPVTGKIRRMSFNSLKKKFDIQKYINNFLT